MGLIVNFEEKHWQQVEKMMEKHLELAKTYYGENHSDHIMLKQGEAHYFTLKNASLIEPRHMRSPRVGLYGGPTIRVGKVPLHLGAFYAT